MATSRFAWATTIAILIVAVIAPLLGAIADYAAVEEEAARRSSSPSASRRPAAMYCIERGDWLFALVLFVIGNVGVAGSIVFYESLLPHLVGEDELDRVSSAGYAVGYLGGGVLLAINLLMISKPGMFGLPDAGVGDARCRLASVGGLVGGVLDSAVPAGAGAAAADRAPANVRRATRSSTARARLVETFHELRRYKQAFLLLLAFLLYNDGIQTIIRMATTYGTEIGIDDNAMILRAADHAVHRHAVRVPVRHRWPDASAPSTAVFVGLAVYAGDHRARLLHDARRRSSSRWRSWSAWCRAARRR